MRSLASSDSVVHSVVDSGAVSEEDGAGWEGGGGGQEGETSERLQQRKRL